METKHSMISNIEDSICEDIIDAWMLYKQDTEKQHISSPIQGISKLTREEMLCLSQVAAGAVLSQLGIIAHIMSTDIRLNKVG